LLGEGDKALEYYLSICPSAKQEKIETYRAEPYVYAQMTAGRDAPTPGEAKNSWLTGTAAWSFVVAAQGILGVQPEFTGLRINPCISKEWKTYSVSREFRGATYNVVVDNPAGVCQGVVRMTVDGVAIEGNIVPVAPAGAVVDVHVTLG
jgi:cellobiose phosphorylase